MKKKFTGGVNVGTGSILVTFVLLCLVTFAALTYQERSVLQRLVSSPDLLGLAKILQPARAQALRARAEDMLKCGQVQIPF